MTNETRPSVLGCILGTREIELYEYNELPHQMIRNAYENMPFRIL